MWRNVSWVARARAVTARAISAEGAGLSRRARKALRIAISILASFHGTTWPLRRMRRTGVAQETRSVPSLAPRL